MRNSCAWGIVAGVLMSGVCISDANAGVVNADQSLDLSGASKDQSMFSVGLDSLLSDASPEARSVAFTYGVSSSSGNPIHSAVSYRSSSMGIGFAAEALAGDDAAAGFSFNHSRQGGTSASSPFRGASSGGDIPGIGQGSPIGPGSFAFSYSPNWGHGGQSESSGSGQGSSSSGSGHGDNSGHGDHNGDHHHGDDGDGDEDDQHVIEMVPLPTPAGMGVVGLVCVAAGRRRRI